MSSVEDSSRRVCASWYQQKAEPLMLQLLWLEVHPTTFCFAALLFSFKYVTVAVGIALFLLDDTDERFITPFSFICFILCEWAIALNWQFDILTWQLEKGEQRAASNLLFFLLFLFSSSLLLCCALATCLSRGASYIQLSWSVVLIQICNCRRWDCFILVRHSLMKDL